MYIVRPIILPARFETSSQSAVRIRPISKLWRREKLIYISQHYDAKEGMDKCIEERRLLGRKRWSCRYGWSENSCEDGDVRLRAEGMQCNMINVLMTSNVCPRHVDHVHSRQRQATTDYSGSSCGRNFQPASNLSEIFFCLLLTQSQCYGDRRAGDRRHSTSCCPLVEGKALGTKSSRNLEGSTGR